MFLQATNSHWSFTLGPYFRSPEFTLFGRPATSRWNRKLAT
jgi:hypothetical protein